ncbi:AVAST type 2 anti-phage system protein Avs2 [Pontibacter sp. 13R65]|uniref:AVAST type 2 anti-phage system protein Avs2 n=1 Tax=Pontibacter sp. 13R65 TaxID=3127458 RepID=UPI00301DD03D
MEQENDKILSRLSVRIKNPNTSQVIGSGTIYHSKHLHNKVYIITAAHCLYADGNSFQQPFDSVDLDIYNPLTNSYLTINQAVDLNTVNPEEEKDLAVLVTDLEKTEVITGLLPQIISVRERRSASQFAIKGFPSATNGEELDSIYPVWKQEMTGSKRFQLQLLEDYKGWATNGFSGSGIFLHTNNILYLFGVFTRYREESRGKVIYCQFIETVNELLEKCFLPTIPFSFLGEHGLTPEFFDNHIAAAVMNLGPRFNENLNFRLSVAKRFNDIAKDGVFKDSLIKCFDKWLVADRPYNQSTEKDLLFDIESENHILRQWAIESIPFLGWAADQRIELAPLLDRIEQLDVSIRERSAELQEKQRQAQQQQEEENKREEAMRYSYHPPFERELARLREIYDTHRQFRNGLDQFDINLANNPYLLIDGEAGSGKSHLLGDMATERNRQGQPTLLLLGQLFSSGQSVWQNVLSQLRLSCSPADLLTSLNNIGKQVGSRALILIDAMNEGAGKGLWHGELAGFICEVSRYPYIGLVLTVRSTYWNAIVPKTLQRDLYVTRLTHQGFKGNEYAALHLFCDSYDLQQPNFPILTPEFTNPLFLLLICEGVKASGRQTFPQGFQGIFAIFQFYVGAISEKLADQRDEYLRRPKLVEQAIREFAQVSFAQSRTRIVPLEKAVDLFDEKFNRHPYLLDDLIREGVFIQNSFTDYSSDNEYEGIYFAYERFGDYIIAQQLLQDFTKPDEAKTAFKEGNTLGALIEEGIWNNGGILEAMAVILPEKWDLELFEAYNWVYAIEDETLHDNIKQQLSLYVLGSLKWRTIQSVNEPKLSEWLRSDVSDIDDDSYFLLLTELATINGHPFNGDRLHQILKSAPMPERDSFWQQHLFYYNGENDNGDGYPIRRLLDWAWQPLVSQRIDSETARLTGQTLAWVLASTNRTLRDQATKAMVNLLEEQLEALESILSTFRDIDDMYIAERLYAVAYGCALRTSNNASLAKLAQHVYDLVFKEGTPLNHILLRDYARNTVEYALYKQVPLQVDTALILPPYHSRMPEEMPSDEEVERHRPDRDSPDYREKYASAVDDIHHSVLTWDFSRYVIDPALSHFSPISFTVEQEYKSFLKSLPPTKRDMVKSFAELYEWQDFSSSEITKYTYDLEENTFVYTPKKNSGIFIEAEDFFRNNLTEKQQGLIYKKIVPHLESIKCSKDRSQNSVETYPLKRWIFKRVMELGYDPELHGYFDSKRSSHYDRFNNRIERIGKKYQWIAFYEIMAIVSDNHKIRERWSSKNKLKYYNGPWELLLRDIDPVFTSRSKKTEEDPDKLDTSTTPPNWWLDSQYTYWNEPASKWATTTEDLPDPKNIILRTDETNQEWLYLKVNVNWQEPKPLGFDKYKINRKEIWYLLQGYLVRRKNKAKVVEWLQEQEFRGHWLPESSTETELLNRENYWSPFSKALQKEQNVWVPLGESKHKVIITTSEAVGEMSQDKSGAHFYYSMPCRPIFEGMGLQYAPIDGEFKNDLGEIVATNINPNGVLIRKTDLINFLNENDLDIVWCLLGKKRSYAGDDRSNNYFSTLSGVYYLEESKVTGGFTLTEDE